MLLSRPLRGFRSQDLLIISALDVLNQSGLLTGEDGDKNRHAVVMCENIGQIADAICLLHKSGLLTGEDSDKNRDAVMTSKNLNAMVYGLRELHKVGLLTGEDSDKNRQALVAIDQMPDVKQRDALYSLLVSGLLTGESGDYIRQVAMTHASIYHCFSDLLFDLSCKKLLKQSNFGHIIHYSDIFCCWNHAIMGPTT